MMKDPAKKKMLLSSLPLLLLLLNFIQKCDGCKEDLVTSSKIGATSQTSLRRMHNIIVWDAKDSNLDQSLGIEFDNLTSVTEIQVKSGKDSVSYVSEFAIQYSADDKGLYYKDYLDDQGLVKVFIVNHRGFNFELPHAITTKRLRVIPTRWYNRISLHIAVRGCNYDEKAISFNGGSFEVKNASNFLHQDQVNIKLRFRTMGESGLIFYAHNKTSEDYLALHLQDSKLYLTLNTLETYSTFSAGSLLDDNFFHYVELSITDSQMLLTLDSVEASSRRLKDTSLKFVDSFVIGESHNNSFEAFRGCLGNIAINRIPIELKSRKSCPRNEATSLMTFFKAKSFLKIDLKRASNLIQEVAFEFKTFEADSLLLYHGLKAGFIRIYLEDSRLKAIITASDDTAASHIELDSFDLAYNDGEWHSVRLAFTETSVNLTIDREILDRRLASKISLRGIFLFGGGLDNEIPGFVGCVKNLQILGSKLNLRSNTVSVKGGSSAAAEVLEDGCVMDDKCSPNPCQHGGICKQNSHEFFCDCEGSGYSGSVCHTSLNYRSCMDFALAKPMIRYIETNVDLDGSGPLPPFPARCEFLPAGRNITYIGHLNEEATKVDGFEEKGSFMQLIHYDATFEAMEALIKSSGQCIQKLGYECKQSRLFDTPVANKTHFSPFGYWTSRQGDIMDYWAGSEPGSFKCECGYIGACFDYEKSCNCDSGHDDWLWDGGELTQKEYLPVKSLHFGDTGTPLDGKEGRYSLGPLECEGDQSKDDSITFHLEQGALELDFTDHLQNGHVWDIYFEFKTASKGMSGTLIQAISPISGDIVQAAIRNGSRIELHYGIAETKGQELILSTDQDLDDNRWHSVLVEWNKKDVAFYLDKNTSVIEKVTPNQRPLMLGPKAFIGATNDFDDGYLGCLRSLWISGIKVDLEGQIGKHPKGVHGVSLGCHGVCDNNPCNNGGLCIENYNDFKCNCAATAFKGQTCHEDVSLSFDGNQLITANLSALRVTNSSSRPNELKAEIGFAASVDAGGLGGFLLGAFVDNQFEGEVAAVDFIKLQLTDKGRVKVEVNISAELQTFTFSEAAAFEAETFHHLRLESFDMGRQIMMRVDDIAQQVFILDKGSVQLPWSSLVVGLENNSSSYTGFQGCLSRLAFDGIAPLKLFVENSDFIEANSNEEPLEVKTCGTTQKLTREADELDENSMKLMTTTMRSGGRRRNNVKASEDKNAVDVGRSGGDDDDGTLFGIPILLYPVILAIVLGIAYVIGMYVKRQTGVYQTREDECVTEAFDADTAVLHSKTGHLVEKKQEWFM